MGDLTSDPNLELIKMTPYEGGTGNTIKAPVWYSYRHDEGSISYQDPDTDSSAYEYVNRPLKRENDKVSRPVRTKSSPLNCCVTVLSVLVLLCLLVCGAGSYFIYHLLQDLSTINIKLSQLNLTNRSVSFTAGYVASSEDYHGSGIQQAAPNFNDTLAEEKSQILLSKAAMTKMAAKLNTTIQKQEDRDENVQLLHERVQKVSLQFSRLNDSQSAQKSRLGDMTLELGRRIQSLEDSILDLSEATYNTSLLQRDSQIQVEQKMRLLEDNHFVYQNEVTDQMQALTSKISHLEQNLEQNLTEFSFRIKSELANSSADLLAQYELVSKRQGEFTATISRAEANVGMLNVSFLANQQHWNDQTQDLQASLHTIDQQLYQNTSDLRLMLKQQSEDITLLKQEWKYIGNFSSETEVLNESLILFTSVFSQYQNQLQLFNASLKEIEINFRKYEDNHTQTILGCTRNIEDMSESLTIQNQTTQDQISDLQHAIHTLNHSNNINEWHISDRAAEHWSPNDTELISSHQGVNESNTEQLEAFYLKFIEEVQDIRRYMFTLEKHMQYNVTDINEMLSTFMEEDLQLSRNLTTLHNQLQMIHTDVVTNQTLLAEKLTSDMTSLASVALLEALNNDTVAPLQANTMRLANEIADLNESMEVAISDIWINISRQVEVTSNLHSKAIQEIETVYSNMTDQCIEMYSNFSNMIQALEQYTHTLVENKSLEIELNKTFEEVNESFNRKTADLLELIANVSSEAERRQSLMETDMHALADTLTAQQNLSSSEVRIQLNSSIQLLVDEIDDLQSNLIQQYTSNDKTFKKLMNLSQLAFDQAHITDETLNSAVLPFLLSLNETLNLTRQLATENRQLQLTTREQIGVLNATVDSNQIELRQLNSIGAKIDMVQNVTEVLELRQAEVSGGLEQRFNLSLSREAERMSERTDQLARIHETDMQQVNHSISEQIHSVINQLGLQPTTEVPIPMYTVDGNLLTGAILQDTRAEITSPNFPSLYPPNKRIFWSVKWDFIGQYHTLNIMLLHFALEGDAFGTDCTFDYLEIMNDIYCGKIWSGTPSQFSMQFGISDKKMITMGFRSDGATMDTGFKFIYQLV